MDSGHAHRICNGRPRCLMNLPVQHQPCEGLCALKWHFPALPVPFPVTGFTHLSLSTHRYPKGCVFTHLSSCERSRQKGGGFNTLTNSVKKKNDASRPPYRDCSHSRRKIESLVKDQQWPEAKWFCRWKLEKWTEISTANSSKKPEFSSKTDPS